MADSRQDMYGDSEFGKGSSEWEGMMGKWLLALETREEPVNGSSSYECSSYGAE